MGVCVCTTARLHASATARNCARLCVCVPMSLCVREDMVLIMLDLDLICCSLFFFAPLPILHVHLSASRSSLEIKTCLQSESLHWLALCAALLQQRQVCPSHFFGWHVHVYVYVYVYVYVCPPFFFFFFFFLFLFLFLFSSSLPPSLPPSFPPPPPPSSCGWTRLLAQVRCIGPQSRTCETSPCLKKMQTRYAWAFEVRAGRNGVCVRIELWLIVSLLCCVVLCCAVLRWLLCCGALCWRQIKRGVDLEDVTLCAETVNFFGGLKQTVFTARDVVRGFSSRELQCARV